MTIPSRLERCEVTKKVCYPSREMALEVAQRREQASGTRIKVYTCSACEALHLSSHFVNREPGSSALGVRIPIQEEGAMSGSVPPSATVLSTALMFVEQYTPEKPARCHTIHGKVAQRLGDRKLKVDTVKSALDALVDRGRIAAVEGTDRERRYYNPTTAPAGKPAAPRPQAAQADAPVDLKRCPRCQTTKARTEFGRDAARPDGFRVWCRACVAANKRDRYARQRDGAQAAPAPVVEAPAAMVQTAIPTAPAPAVEPSAPALVVEVPALGTVSQTRQAAELLLRCIDRERETWVRERARLVAERDAALELSRSAPDVAAERDQAIAERDQAIAERDAALELGQELERKIARMRENLRDVLGV